MRTYELKPRVETESLPGMPVYDDGKRILKVYRPESSNLILAACARRKVAARVIEKEAALLITVISTKEQFEAVREEFNQRPLR